MTYSLAYSKRADKDLSKLDAPQRKIIVAWLSKNIKDCENPRVYGKALEANHIGKWRYRIGKYRVLVKIDDEKLIVLALQIGHRREIYR